MHPAGFVTPTRRIGAVASNYLAHGRYFTSMTSMICEGVTSIASRVAPISVRSRAGSARSAGIGRRSAAVVAEFL